MRFVNPLFLYLGFFFLTILVMFFYWDEIQRKRLLHVFAKVSLWPSLMPNWLPKRRLQKTQIRIIALCFLLISLARPQWGYQEEIRSLLGLDVMFVLDVSQSMNAQDVAPSRMQKSKHLIRSILKQLQGHRAGLVEFAASAHVVCPLTTDLAYLSDLLDFVNPDKLQHQGTWITRGLEVAWDALRRGAEQDVNANAEIPSHAIVLISDGEDDESDAEKIAVLLKDKNIPFYIFGIGTKEGGPIPIMDDFGNLIEFKKDKQGQPIVSKFQPDFLKKLASIGNGFFWDTTPQEIEVQSFIKKISELRSVHLKEKKVRIFNERFQVFLIFGLFILGLELSISFKKTLIYLLFLFLGTERVEAKSLYPYWNTYQDNQEGLKAYSNKQYEKAKQKFGSAQARDPLRSELDFNQATVHAIEGSLDLAIDHFKSAIDQAKKVNNLNILAHSFYNLGNTLAKKGNHQEAVESFVQAIEHARFIQDKELEYEARKNLQILMNQPRPSPQPSNGQKNDDQSNKKDSKSNESVQKESLKNDKNLKREEDLKSSSKEDNQKNIQPDKLSQEETEQVLSKLAEKEKKIQEKLKVKHDKNNHFIPNKDW